MMPMRRLLLCIAGVILLAGSLAAEHPWRSRSAYTPRTANVPSPSTRNADWEYQRLPPTEDHGAGYPSSTLPPIQEPIRAKPAAQLPHLHQPYISAPVPAANSSLTPWWDRYVTRPLRNAQPQPYDLNSLIALTLQSSPRVRAIQVLQPLAGTAIAESAAEFDPRLFAESKLIRTSDPVGNILETGGPPRLRRLDFGSSFGLNKRTTSGGEFEVSQRLGLEDSNSLFFLPENQGNSRLVLSFTQPLLNGRGKVYNTSLIAIAEIDERIAGSEVSRQLQDHLIKVHRAYWDVYLQRSLYMQRKRHVARAKEVLDELVRRKEIDASKVQILRAEAAVATRQADLSRAEAGVRNSETRLRALVGMPATADKTELIPKNPPSLDLIPLDLADAAVTALQYRPEISQLGEQVQAASVRLNMAQHELLPVLDAVLETYVAGLRGDYDVTGSLRDQFSKGEPSYTAGLAFEFPYRNQAAQARRRRRELEVRRLSDQLEDTISMIRAEVEVAVRDVDTTHRELVGRSSAVASAAAEVDYLAERLNLLAGERETASVLLNFLLDAQDRLSDEEFAMAKAQTDYVFALINVKRVMGTLLTEESLVPQTSGQSIGE